MLETINLTNGDDNLTIQSNQINIIKTKKYELYRFYDKS